MTDPTPAAPRPTSRRRGVLAGVALVLACVSILFSTLAVWTHQVALNTDRFTALVADVAGDPALVDPIAARVSTQVVEALDIQTRIADTLPGPSKVLAPAMTNAVREAIDKRLQMALADPRIQKALLNTISFTHERVVGLLRGEGDALSVVDGYVYINVFPIVGAALTELQSMGLIPASVTLPDLSSPEAPDVLAGRLEAALGITLPDTFGSIKLMPADRLLAAQNVVRIFDLVVVALLILTAVLIALALWLATSRRRMVIALAIGTIIAFLLARLALRGIRESLIEGVADADLAAALRAVAEATFADLRGLTIIILIATAILGIVAYLWGRPTWVTQASSAVAGAASGAASNAASSASSAAGAAPSRDALATTARVHRVRIERVGLVAIGFIVLWIAVGPEVALLGVALLVGWELIVRALGGESDTESGTSDPGPDATSAG